MRCHCVKRCYRGSCGVILVLLFMNYTQPACFTLFPYTTLFRSLIEVDAIGAEPAQRVFALLTDRLGSPVGRPRSEEHTSELHSQIHLVCRLLHEKKKISNAFFTPAFGRISIIGKSIYKRNGRNI